MQRDISRPCIDPSCRRVFDACLSGEMTLEEADRALRELNGSPQPFRILDDGAPDQG